MAQVRASKIQFLRLISAFAFIAALFGLNTPLAVGQAPVAPNAPLFAPAVAYDSGGYTAWSVAVADVNGDGKPDLLVANSCLVNDCSRGAVSVLLGNGDGTFRVPVSYGSGGWAPRSIAVADVNGDGKPDLVVANCGRIGISTCPSASVGNGVLGIFLGNGDGTFQAVATYDSGGVGAQSVAIADVNGDGKPDLLVANGCDPQHNLCRWVSRCAVRQRRRHLSAGEDLRYEV
jgi:hypothetical protein